jgi:hypothetical protein
MKSKLVFAIALILTAFASTALADPIGGNRHYSGLLTPGNSDTYFVSVNGQEYTDFRVTGDGNSDLDCYVYDSSGSLVSSDTDYTDTCAMRISARYEATVRLVVKNNGRLYDAYSAMVY